MKNQLPVFLSVITVLTFAVLSPVVNHDFINLDDPSLIINDTNIRGISINNIASMFTGYRLGLYDPLVSLTHSLEYYFFKLNPSVYHLDNLLLHLFNCVLVFWFISLLSGENRLAFIVALFFGIHPMHVESVAWAAERKDVLYAFFFLLSLVYYLKYTDKKQVKYYYLSLFVFLLSLLSKSMAVMLPVVLLLVDFIKSRKIRIKMLKDKIPYFALSFVFGAVTILAQKSIENIAADEKYSILNVFNELVFYIVKLFAPLKLSCLYPSVTKLGGIYSDTILTSALIICMSVLAVDSLKKTGKVFFGFAFFIITLLPVLHFIPTGNVIPADRYTYIPYIGLFYLLGVFILYLMEKSKDKKFLKILVLFPSICLVLWFSFLSHKRVHFWKNSITLFNEDIHNYPEADARLYNNRGDANTKRNRYDLAIADYSKAIEMMPNFADAYYNRGIAYYSTWSYDKAIADYTSAIKYRTDYAGAYINRGNVYMKIKKYDRAIADYGQAIKINDAFLEAYFNRALAFSNVNEPVRAVSDYIRILELKKDFPNVFSNLVKEYAKLNENQKKDIDAKIAGRFGNGALEVIKNTVKNLPRNTPH